MRFKLEMKKFAILVTAALSEIAVYIVNTKSELKELKAEMHEARLSNKTLQRQISDLRNEIASIKSAA